MEDRTRVIKIESILGGQSPTTHFGASDQFRASIGIDPGMPINDNQDRLAHYPSGLLHPVAVSGVSTTFGSPKWIIESPKNEGTLYIYDAAGSVYTVNDVFGGFTGIGDLNDGGSAEGNGGAYYDNYIYFARDTTIARYGPLDGTAAFTDDYWVSTLGKSALTNTPYPLDFDFSIEYPNHVMHRHSDGRLYIADVVGNQGTIHYIQTTKTTDEGDTDAGSTYSKLQVGYGLWPTAIESYGTDLVISFIELTRASGQRSIKGPRAKVAFWDTTSQNINKITWVEFPDQMITAMKNINGTLYIISGNQYAEGFRISRFIGGYTFEQVAFIPSGSPSFAGAVDGDSNRLMCGSWTYVPEESGTVFSYGLAGFNSPGIFSIVAVRGFDSDNTITNPSCFVTALKYAASNDGTLIENGPVMGVSNPVRNHSIMLRTTDGDDYETAPEVFWSQIYRIGQPFKIKKIRLPLAQAMAANMTLTAKIYTDDGAGTTYTLASIDNTNDPGAFNVIRRSGSSGETITGQHNFWLELRWTGSALCVVGLPITIEYELIDD